MPSQVAFEQGQLARASNSEGIQQALAQTLQQVVEVVASHALADSKLSLRVAYDQQPQQDSDHALPMVPSSMPSRSNRGASMDQVAVLTEPLRAK